MYDRFELDFLSIGENGCSGDAICVRYGTQQSHKIHVVDGGFKSSGTDLVTFIRNHYDNPTFLDNVVLTHPDGDHAGGLLDLLDEFQVGALWMNRPWLFSNTIIENFHGNWTTAGLVQELRANFSTLAELEQLAISKGIPIYPPFQGTTIGPFHVLGPSQQRYLELLPEMDKTPNVIEKAAQALYRVADQAITAVKESWTGETLSSYPPATTASNEASIVQYASIAGKDILLTGDAGPGTLTETLNYATALGLNRPDIVQVPHHGSRRNVTPEVLNGWLGTPLTDNSLPPRGKAYCSAATDDERHPKKKVLNAFLRRGYPVRVTKGGTWSTRENMPQRLGWEYRDPEPFHSEVED